MVTVPRLPRVHSALARGWLWLIGGAVLVAGIASDLPNWVEQPCPGGEHAAQPVEINLVPTAIRHQSWVGISASLVALNMELVACVDGRIAGRSVVDQNDIDRTVATINVATHWVMLTWVAGRIDDYRDPQHWLVIVLPQGTEPQPEPVD